MPATWPKPTELAILTVNGQHYQDWESVTVRHAETEPPYYTFRFTCSEFSPIGKNLAVMRIKPGDACTITLAGELAFTGLVHTRQVYYDATRHYIEIQGASNILHLSYSSVVHQTHEENNIKWDAYIRKLISHHKIPFVIEGGAAPQFTFPRIAVAPGTSVMEAIEIPTRAMQGGIKFTSDVKGSLVAIVGPSGGSDTLWEGENILEGREVIYNPGMANGSYVAAQSPGGDAASMTKVASEMFHTSTEKSAIAAIAPLLTTLELPGFAKEMLIGRNNSEARMQSEDWITVYITVHGWLRPSGGLWYRNQQVNVVSPMLIMHGGENLHAKTVTFTQDNRSGTRTVLELCNDKAMSQTAQSGTGSGQETGREHT